ncbi:MAG: hypothetical protein HY644_09175 [Acidobacteria bacterium]|nr:hypothetical protein [Acidobacteriota bacterium]
MRVIEQNHRQTASIKVPARVTVFMLLWLSTLVVAAAQQSEGTASTRLDLGYDKSNPGGQAFVPLIFSPGVGVQVGSVLAEVTFPTKQLAFEEAKRGASADSGDVELHTAVKNDDKNADRSIVEIKVENKAGKPLPGGVIANLVFKILDGVDVGQKISLENRAQALTTDNPPKTMNLVAANGEIETIAVPVIFACFFYMH